MTLTLVDHSRCSLCDEAFGPADDVVAATAFVDDPDSDLFPFSDTAMHRTCFIAWPERGRFVAAYNEHFAKHFRGVEYMYPDGRTEQRAPRQQRKSALDP